MDIFKGLFSSAFYFKDGLCYLKILYFNLRVSHIILSSWRSKISLMS